MMKKFVWHVAKHTKNVIVLLPGNNFYAGFTSGAPFGDEILTLWGGANGRTFCIEVSEDSKDGDAKRSGI